MSIKKKKTRGKNNNPCNEGRYHRDFFRDGLASSPVLPILLELYLSQAFLQNFSRAFCFLLQLKQCFLPAIIELPLCLLLLLDSNEGTKRGPGKCQPPYLTIYSWMSMIFQGKHEKKTPCSSNYPFCRWICKDFRKDLIGFLAHRFAVIFSFIYKAFLKDKPS